MASLTKTAIITGAARGIGKGIALQLAKDGFNIAIADLPHQSEIAAETVKEVEALGAKVKFFPSNVSVREEVFNLVDTVHKTFGTFNVMVNNAGVSPDAPVLSITSADIDKLFNINVKGALWGIQAAAEKFQELDQPGKIINACSTAGTLAIPGLGAYSASKFAVKGLTQVAAMELGKSKITVNAYAPGMVLTQMFHEFADKTPGFEDSGFDTIALKRAALPNDIAGLVSFLASEKSDYINGQSIHVDGGWVYN